MIRVLVVDDSALMRDVLTAILSSDPDIEVVGAACDPYVARDMIKDLNPDVLTLDIEMPRMDGLTFLKNLMRLRPMPVVMVSTLTERGCAVTLDALAIGALDYVAKPKTDQRRQLTALSDELIAKVKAAKCANVTAADTSKRTGPPKAATGSFASTKHVIAIGASTGGTEAIREVLTALPTPCPPIVIAQHIPGAFSAPFAARLNGMCSFRVCEAADGVELLPGTVHIAPGGKHLEVARTGGSLHTRVHEGEAVNRHRPSVDVLFDSVAKIMGRSAVGVLLTGMGADGAAALGRMRAAGAYTIAQDEATSVVWGMPGAAVKMDAVDDVLPLGKIAAVLLKSRGGKPVSTEGR